VMIGDLITRSTIQITKKAAWFSLAYALLFFAVILGIFLIFRDSILSIFLDKPDVLERGIPVIPILCLCEMFDMGQSIMASIFRGLGKQLSASILTFVQFYVIMTTASWLIGNYFGYGVKGMWIGICMGYCAAFIFYLILFSCFDLNKIQIETKKRLERDQENVRSFIKETEDALITSDKQDDKKKSFLDQSDTALFKEDSPNNADIERNTSERRIVGETGDTLTEKTHECTNN
jgi:hypothetical protein